MNFDVNILPNAFYPFWIFIGTEALLAAAVTSG